MNELNMRLHTGYPMLQQMKFKDGIMEFCHNGAVAVGDQLEYLFFGKDINETRTGFITEILQERLAKGNHKDHNTKWYQVKFL